MTSAPTHRRLRVAAFLGVASMLLLPACGDTGNTDDRDGARATASSDVSSGASPSGSPTVDVTPVPDAGGSAVTTPQEDVFSAESPWNTSVVGAPVAPDSAAMLRGATLRTVVGADGRTTTEPVVDGVHVNTRAWTVPIVAGGVPTLVTCRQVTCGDGSDDLTLDIPPGVDPNPLYDGWFTVFEPATRTAYDLWRARREDDGSISYQLLRQWDLDGPGFSQPSIAGARGSGLPLFAGLIRPVELETCSIDHALAISVPGPAAGYYVQPASSTDGTNTSSGSVPLGARIRLGADVTLQAPVDPGTGEPLPFTAERRRFAGCIVEALQTYGAYVVDRAAAPTLYFQLQRVEEGRRPLLNGYELSSLGLDDFAVIDFSDQTRYSYPPEPAGTDDGADR